MNATDRAKNVQEYYAAIAADRAKKRDDTFTIAVDSWLDGPIGEQPSGDLSHIIIRYTDCELVVLSSSVSGRTVDAATEKSADLGYRTETLVDGDISYFHVYDEASREYMLAEYPDYTLFSL